jgi:uncharacterized protein HemX
MARNRKNGSSAIRLGPVLKALLLCLVIGGSGVGYVWQKEQINCLSQQIDKRGARLTELLEENESRKRLLANLRSPACLEARIKELNLGLVQPQPTQIWHLSEPPRQWPPPARDPQYAAQEGRPPAARRNNELMSP